MRGIHATTFQVTDLARRHTAVVDAARHGGALIRDKDGSTLALTLAGETEAIRELARFAGDLIRLQRVLQTTEPSIVAYGDLAWLSVMDRANQTAFLDEAVPLLLVALTGGSPDAVFELIEDWQVTARLWSDEELRRELASDVEAPLPSVEL